MIQFVYPAVFYINEDELKEPFCVYFPDLDIGTEGVSIEEAYLFGKDYLRQYMTLAIKNEIDYPMPSKYQKVSKEYNQFKTMLIDTIIDEDYVRKNKSK